MLRGAIVHEISTRLTQGVGRSIRTSVRVIGGCAYEWHRQTRTRAFGLQGLRRLGIRRKGKVQRQGGIRIPDVAVSSKRTRDKRQACECGIVGWHDSHAISTSPTGPVIVVIRYSSRSSHFWGLLMPSHVSCPLVTAQGIIQTHRPVLGAEHECARGENKDLQLNFGDCCPGSFYSMASRSGHVRVSLTLTLTLAQSSHSAPLANSQSRRSATVGQVSHTPIT